MTVLVPPWSNKPMHVTWFTRQGHRTEISSLTVIGACQSIVSWPHSHSSTRWTAHAHVHIYRIHLFLFVIRSTFLLPDFFFCNFEVLGDQYQVREGIRDDHQSSPKAAILLFPYFTTHTCSGLIYLCGHRLEVFEQNWNLLLSCLHVIMSE